MAIFRGYDASNPPVNPPAWDFVGFYIGGNTPHVWQDKEIDAQPARYRLPIFVHTGTDTTDAGLADGREMVGWLRAHLVPLGSLVAIDTETSIYHDYLAAMDVEIVGAGYKLLNYGSLEFVIQNHITSGGRWSAHWTDIPRIDPGHNVVMTQWANASMLHTDYDGDVCDSSLHLWDSRPVVSPVPSWEERVAREARTAATALSTLLAILRRNEPRI